MDWFFIYMKNIYEKILKNNLICNDCKIRGNNRKELDNYKNSNIMIFVRKLTNEVKKWKKVNF